MDLSSSYLWQPSLFIEGSGTNVSGGISILRVSYPSFAKIGSPVTKGEKWALNIWIKENELKNNKEIDKKFIESEHKKYPPKKKLEVIL